MYPLALTAMRDPLNEVRLVAVRTLARTENAEHRAALVAACLEDEDRFVRSAAADSIRKYQGDEAISELLAAALSGEPHALRASDALGSVREMSVAEPLLYALPVADPLARVFCRPRPPTLEVSTLEHGLSGDRAVAFTPLRVERPRGGH